MKRLFVFLCVFPALYALKAWGGNDNPYLTTRAAIEDPFDYTTFAMNANTTPPVQRVDVVNMLWNPNATNGVAGFTQTPVTVNFFQASNGNKCASGLVPFEGAMTVLAGQGLPCPSLIGNITVVPTASAAGMVFNANNVLYALNPNYFSTQLIVTNGTDPTFDATNGTVATPGTIAFTHQGQF